MKQLILCLMLAFAIVAPSVAMADFMTTSSTSAPEEPGIMSTIFSGISTAATSLWEGIKAFGSWIKNSWVGQAVGTLAGYVQTGVSTAYEYLAGGAKKAYSYAKDGVMYVYDKTINLFKPDDTQVADTSKPQTSEADLLKQALDAQQAALAASEETSQKANAAFEDLKAWDKTKAEPATDQINQASLDLVSANAKQQEVKAAIEAKKKALERATASEAGGVH